MRRMSPAVTATEYMRTLLSTISPNRTTQSSIRASATNAVSLAGGRDGRASL